MANHKRKRPRKQVRCSLCTDGRGNIGGERQWREREALKYEEEAAQKFTDYMDCPDCGGTGRCTCKQCVGEKIGCLACSGTGIL